MFERDKNIKNNIMKTIEEIIEIVNKIKGCFAYESENGVEVTVRSKKSDKVFIENNEVSFQGNCLKYASHIANELEYTLITK